jgi:hypothetical protein
MDGWISIYFQYNTEVTVVQFKKIIKNTEVTVVQ